MWEKTKMADVRDAILNSLYWDVAIPRGRLSVAFQNGCATLSGEVDRPYEKSCAEADVRRVPGVVGVKNKIAIHPFGSKSLDPLKNV
jgi:osmotically-inducible protein OsmY